MKKVVTAVALAAVSCAGVASGLDFKYVWVLECEFTHTLTVEDGFQPISSEIIESGATRGRFERADWSDTYYEVATYPTLDGSDSYYRSAVQVHEEGDLFQILSEHSRNIALTSVAESGDIVTSTHKLDENGEIEAIQYHGRCQESRVHSTPFHPYTINNLD